MVTFGQPSAKYYHQLLVTGAMVLSQLVSGKLWPLVWQSATNSDARCPDVLLIIVSIRNVFPTNA